MRSAMLALALPLLSTACGTVASHPASDAGAQRAAPAFQANALRQPAVFIRVEIAGRFSARQVTSWPAEYEGALLEGLNARAVPARDARLLTASERLVPAEALARAREVGADHALLVDARLHQAETAFCRSARPFRAAVMVWSQRVRVLRVSDGGVAFETTTPIDVPGVEANCDAPRESRRRTPAEHVSAAVDALLERLLGS
jgi:hypothetical protein